MQLLTYNNALKAVNAIRNYFGKQSLERIPSGVPGSTENCPMQKALRDIIPSLRVSGSVGISDEDLIRIGYKNIDFVRAQWRDVAVFATEFDDAHMKNCKNCRFVKLKAPNGYALTDKKFCRTHEEFDPAGYVKDLESKDAPKIEEIVASGTTYIVFDEVLPFETETYECKAEEVVDAPAQSYVKSGADPFGLCASAAVACPMGIGELSPCLSP